VNECQSRTCHVEVGVEPMPSTNESDELIEYADLGEAKAACGDCADILHGLNNVLASMLLNAQVMEWKLPSYSRSKRYLHEIERNAQRGGELVKRLLGRLQLGCRVDLSPSRDCEVSSTVRGTEIALAAHEPDAVACGLGSPIDPAAHATPVFRDHRKKVSHTTV
jgi:hypothetical protein